MRVDVEEKAQGIEKHEASVMPEAQFWLYKSNECPSRWSQATGSALPSQQTISQAIFRRGAGLSPVRSRDR